MTDTSVITETDGRYSITGSVSLDELLDSLKVILRSKLSDSDPFTDPQTVRAFLIASLSNREREEFLCLFLNNRHRLIREEVVATGTINQATVHPREVVKAALKHNAAAIILAHNHPSGIPEPSSADKRLTNRLKDACGLVDIRVLDHFIVAGDECVSFAEKGLI